MLGAAGVEAVRVEALARSLGVTKGGFYGYFADRRELLREMLAVWERESVDDVIVQIAGVCGDPLDRVRLAGRLTFSSDRLLPIDLAVRDWARRDAEVAERLRGVDNRRLQLLREAIAQVCDDPEEVEARCLLAFCLAIGHHFLAADHPGRSRDQAVARAGDLLLQRPAG